MNGCEESTGGACRQGGCRTGAAADGDAVTASPLLHIGFFKTASSWLQRYLFTPPFGYQHVVDAFALQSLLVGPSREAFDTSSARDRLLPTARAIAAEGRVPVVSSEALSGDLLRGGRNRWQNADRLRQVFPRARTLLIAREQGDLLRSLYKTLVLWGSTDPVSRMVSDAARGRGFDPAQLEFHALARHYAGLYGPQAVLVLPYELFRERPALFLGYLYRHCGLDTPDPALVEQLPLKDVVNPGEPLAFLHLQRWLNRLSFTSHRDYAGLRDNNSFERVLKRIAWHRRHARGTMFDAALEARFARQVNERLVGRFAASNRELQRFCPVSLDEFGYQC
jgi:hypothetical protein